MAIKLAQLMKVLSCLTTAGRSLAIRRRDDRQEGLVSAVLSRLAERRSVDERVIIVAAHPDDETIGVGAQLCQLRDLLIVHITDGAPRDGRAAARRGFASVKHYAEARRRELANALAAGGAGGARTIAFDIPDQEASLYLARLTRRIADLITSERPVAVITHAYEGGHPDHDATAFVVHAARRILPAHTAPGIIEMALYHSRCGEVIRGDFLPAGTTPTTIPLAEQDICRKQQMFECFATQRGLLNPFPLDCERLRIAPAYNFRLSPHFGVLHYETLGWNASGAEWRRLAADAMAELKLADLPGL
jgi:LmbE family N-acetylglucosaminyl deacetylase